MNIEEAINEAMAYETRIRDLYHEAASQTHDTKGRHVYATLADDEQLHIDYLEQKRRQWRQEGVLTLEPLISRVPPAARFQAEMEGLQVQMDRGLKQRLACLVLTDSRVVALGKEPIRPYGTDQIIGWVATGGYGYTIEKSIVYAYLPIDYTLPGIEMEIEFFGEWVRAQVVQAPLFDPRGERVRA